MSIMPTSLHVSYVHGESVVEVVKVRGRTGTTSVEITIPKAFAEKLDLKAGDHISVELVSDGRIQLRKVKP
jgi:AbrB family looped-hinge helix DNA binding protein